MKNVSTSLAAEWITGGPSGSKDAVLVFRICALNPEGYTSADVAAASDDSAATGVTVQGTTSSSAPGAATTAAAYLFDPETKENLSTAARTRLSGEYRFRNISTDKGLNKRAHESLSSSDTSISSVDPSVTVNEDSSTAAGGSKDITCHKKRSHDSLSLSDHSILSNYSDQSVACSENLSSTANSRESRACKSISASSKMRKASKSRERQVLSKVEINRITGAVTTADKEEEKKSKNDTCAAAVTTLDVSDMPGAKLKITYKIINTETRLLRRILHSHGLTEANDVETYNLLWAGAHIKTDVLRNLSPYQRVNHFPRYVILFWRIWRIHFLHFSFADLAN